MPAFRSNRPLTARWRSLEGDGLDHVSVEVAQDRLIARGTAIGARGGAPYGVFHRIDMTHGWGVREVAIGTADGRGLHLLTDGNGHWATGTGEPLPALDGCVDVDLAGTPFTNTLPIRRRDWRAGESVQMRMAYVPFDTFQPVADGQIYTCLEPCRRFLYQAADRSFEAELTIDEDGLVVDYRRSSPGSSDPPLAGPLAPRRRRRTVAKVLRRAILEEAGFRRRADQRTLKRSTRNERRTSVVF